MKAVCSTAPHQKIFIKELSKTMNHKKVILLLFLLGACDKKEAVTEVKNVTLPIASSFDQVVALGRIEPEGRIVSLAGEVSGIVNDVRVAEGQVVTKGTPIVELRHDVQQAKVEQTKSQYATQQAQISSDKSILERAKIELKNQEKTLARIRVLASKEAETLQTLDDSESLFKQQELEVTRLQQSLEINERKLKEIQAAIVQAEAEVAQCIIKAPSSGKLLRLGVIAGDALDAGKTIGDFAPEGRTSALCEVDELFATMMQPGLKAYVRILGKTDTLAVGAVSYVGAYLKKKSLLAETAGDAEDRRVREVRIILNDADKLLFNTRVECIIQLPAKK
jgi:HlyD family secretion protein